MLSRGSGPEEPTRDMANSGAQSTIVIDNKPFYADGQERMRSIHRRAAPAAGRRLFPPMTAAQAASPSRHTRRGSPPTGIPGRGKTHSITVNVPGSLHISGDRPCDARKKKG